MTPVRFVITQLAVMATLYALAISAAWPARRLLGTSGDSGHRHRHLDGLRGIAAVGVVACHINQYTSEVMGLPLPELGNHVGILAVQMFFALTAFLFTERALQGRLDPPRFYVGRVFRIVPLYVVAVGAALVLGLHASWSLTQPIAQSLHEGVRVLTYGFWQHDALPFRGFNMLSLIGIAWTLSYEWAFYLLLVPVFYLWRTSGWMALLVCAAVITLLVHHYSIQREQIIWPFFLPGVIAAATKQRWQAIPARWQAIAGIAAVPLAALALTRTGYWTPVNLVLASALFLSVLYSRGSLLRWSPLQTLGTISYSVYLLQYLVMYVCRQIPFLFPSLFESLFAKLALGALMMICLVIVSAFSYRWIEKPWITCSTPRPASA
jgi:peptidoglycan/LPS O-acetylase OafA/YrhL